ncbi:MAG: zinc ribbon domain-containing protein [Acidobacteria bacterium]|nr:zinc ribbon domain-containing protein [Acidobacteriota bacterium]
MFCPNCGTENSKGQKFCTRCGTNLLAIDRAREIISEMNTVSVPSVSPNLVFVTVAVLSIIGFISITIGTYEMMRGDGKDTPLPTIFALGGFSSLVLICRYLLGLIKPVVKVEKPVIPSPPATYNPPTIQRGTTNKALNEAAPYQSVIEDPTRQFEHERNS